MGATHQALPLFPVDSPGYWNMAPEEPGARLDWTVGPDLVAELAQECPMVRPHFEAGDALFFDHLSLHRTGHAANQSRNRHALESWFYTRSATGGRPVIPFY